MILEIRTNEGVYVAEFKKKAAIEMYDKLGEDKFHFAKDTSKKENPLFRVLHSCHLSFFDELLTITLFKDYYIKIKV